MFQSQRCLSNPPAFYYQLTAKQQRHWRRTTKKIEHNEELRQKYPPFQAAAHIETIHIHHQTAIHTIDELIHKAKHTSKYVLDTESQKGKSHDHGALIQIQFLHSTSRSTIILIEVNHLPAYETPMFVRIKDLCNTIFSNKHQIISWGPLLQEIDHFQHLELIHIGEEIESIDLQSEFRHWHKHRRAHPAMERRDDVEMEENEFIAINQDNKLWSLQDAIAMTFRKFLDKSETVNLWNCGLDLQLNTWHENWFGKRKHDWKLEQQKRSKMTQYAINDCASVAELFLHMYPSTVEQCVTPTDESMIEWTNPLNELREKLSTLEEDEIVERLRPKFYPKEGKPRPLSNERIESIEAASNEMNHFIGINGEQMEGRPTVSTTNSKSERQRKKNLKLKWKQRNRIDFQNKLRRPIYHRYDFRKIRAQLRDDNIFTSHQITVNRQQDEVTIGFKSAKERDQASTIVRINYFSKQQYIYRWGGRRINETSHGGRFG